VAALCCFHFSFVRRAFVACSCPVFFFVLQGTHTAMKSGMLAAEATYNALKDDTVKSGNISSYQTVRLLHGWFGLLAHGGSL
jgi:hypothetical protein